MRLPKEELDARLDALWRSAKPGEALSLRQIADGMGCSNQLVREIEQRALGKLRRRVTGTVDGEVLRELFSGGFFGGER